MPVRASDPNSAAQQLLSSLQTAAAGVRGATLSAASQVAPRTGALPGAAATAAGASARPAGSVDRYVATGSAMAPPSLANLVGRPTTSGQLAATAGGLQLSSAALSGEPAPGPAAAGAAAAAPDGATLNVDSQTAPDVLGQFLAAPTARPKTALTKDGAAYLVLGTYQDPVTQQTMVRTADPQNPLGGSDSLTLAQFQKNIAVVQNSQSQPNTPLQVPTDSRTASLLANTSGLQAGDQITFNGFYQDPDSQAVMASLSDRTQGTHLAVNSGDFAAIFGQQAQQAVHDSLTGSAQNDFKLRGMGGQSGDGYSIGPASKVGDVDAWLQASSSPMLADTKDGGRSLVQAGPAGSSTVTVTPLSPPGAATTSMSTAALMQAANYLDRATSGQGTQITAQASVGGLVQGSRYTFQGLATAAGGGVSVKLKGDDGRDVELGLESAQAALGTAGIANLVDSAQTNPLGPRDQTRYKTVQNSELFDPGAGSQKSVTQGKVGDCYLEATLSGLEKTSPNFLQNMVRPSQDGNPDHVDVRFFAPGADGVTRQPVWITVSKELPVDDQGKVSGSQDTLGEDGIADIGPALIEKAYVQFNQQYHSSTATGGYAGIAGGSPAQAMQVLTGQAGSAVPAGSSDLWSTLQGSNQGKVVVLATNPGNTPLPGLAANVVAGHAYTVLGTSTDALGNQSVTLRNPWGANTDAEGNPLKDTDGEFTLPLSAVQKYFNAAFTGGVS